MRQSRLRWKGRGGGWIPGRSITYLDAEPVTKHSDGVRQVKVSDRHRDKTAFAESLDAS